MGEVLTSVLDALGLLLIAAGAAVFVAQWSTGGALTVAGVIVLAGSALASWQPRPRKRAGL